MVQEFLNRRLQTGDSIRKIQVMRTVLSAALTRADREELIVRNVARLDLHRHRRASPPRYAHPATEPARWHSEL